MATVSALQLHKKGHSVANPLPEAHLKIFVDAAREGRCVVECRFTSMTMSLYVHDHVALRLSMTMALYVHYHVALRP